MEKFALAAMVAFAALPGFDAWVRQWPGKPLPFDPGKALRGVTRPGGSQAIGDTVAGRTQEPMNGMLATPPALA